MPVRTPLSEMFGIEHPLFAFCLTKEIVVEVSRAGGFGVLGALRYTPDELDADLAWIDEHIDGEPYGVDVVMPASYEGAGIDDLGVLMEKLQDQIPDDHRRFVDRVLERYGVPPLPQDAQQVRGLLGWTDVTARPQVEVALKHPIRLLANALGPPPRDIVDEAHGHGVKVAALVGSADQARRQIEVGVDIVVAQGTEAAGHTPDITTFVLVPEVVDAVAPAPVLAAGGVGTGRQMAAGLALGAQGVWTGSIWLTVTEADFPPLLIEKMLRATSRDTVRTRALSGKPARLLRSAWTDAWESPESPGTLPMPLQFMLTSGAMARIMSSQNPDLLFMPVGQIVGTMNERLPAAEVVARIVRDCDETLARLRAIGG